MKNKITLFTFFLFWLWTFIAHTQCAIHNRAYEVGEKLSYTGYYNLGFIWLDAGYVNFSISDTVFENKKMFKFTTIGGSNPGYDWIMKVRENFLTLSDYNTLKPYYCERKSIEGSYWVDNTIKFDYNKKKIYANINNQLQGKYRDTIPLEVCTFDYLSAVYYARSLNYSSFKPEQKIPIRVADDTIYNLYVRYKGIEKIHLKDIGLELECIKATIMLIEGTVFNSGENMTIWLTNDLNRIPVQIEAKILVGSVKAILSKTEGLKYKSEADLSGNNKQKR